MNKFKTDHLEELEQIAKIVVFEPRATEDISERKQKQKVEGPQHVNVPDPWVWERLCGVIDGMIGSFEVEIGKKLYKPS
jgi:hypothetical protein